MTAFSITGASAAQAYHETLWYLRAAGEIEDSRNGPVISFPGPFILTITNPEYRIIRCPVRNANPFFHVMETVWMFAARRDAAWLAQFNKRYVEYADEGIVQGAYGYRWLRTWGNQIRTVVEKLRANPNTRQAVINMWDPSTDNAEHWHDRPCNTQLFFRVKDRELTMTVCNRSNDMIWGMFGANVVHMTYLQELIARASGLELGKYHVMSNNLHFYIDAYPNGKAIMENIVEGPDFHYATFPILAEGEDLDGFLRECSLFCDGDDDRITSPWLKQVASPMRRAYLATMPEARLAHCQLIEDYGWRKAAVEFLERAREKNRTG